MVNPAVASVSMVQQRKEQRVQQKNVMRWCLPPRKWSALALAFLGCSPLADHHLCSTSRIDCRTSNVPGISASWLNARLPTISTGFLTSADMSFGSRQGSVLPGVSTDLGNIILPCARLCHTHAVEMHNVYQISAAFN